MDHPCILNVTAWRWAFSTFKKMNISLNRTIALNIISVIIVDLKILNPRSPTVVRSLIAHVVQQR